MESWPFGNCNTQFPSRMNRIVELFCWFSILNVDHINYVLHHISDVPVSGLHKSKNECMLFNWP